MGAYMTVFLSFFFLHFYPIHFLSRLLFGLLRMYLTRPLTYIPYTVWQCLHRLCVYFEAGIEHNKQNTEGKAYSSRNWHRSIVSAIQQEK